MTRTELAAALHATYAHLAAEAGQVDTGDTPDGYGPDIDKALRELGVPEASLATYTIQDYEVKAVEALAHYYAALRLAGRLADRVGTGIPNVEGDRQSLFSRALSLAEMWARIAAKEGYPVDGRGIWALRRVRLDISEPEA